MDEILLTMGMVAYNEEKYIAGAIESLLAQTYKDFLLIISDNASTDRTQQICQDYAKRDKRITYARHNENKGSIFNFQYVLARAKTPYFMWCGGHDVWHPQFAEKLLSAFGNNDIILSYPKSCEMDMDGKIGKTFNDGCTTTNIDSPVRRCLRVLWKMSFNMGSLWYGIWSTEALKKCDLNIKTIFSDDILLAQATLEGKFKQHQEALFFQRINRKKEGYRQGIMRQVVAANGKTPEGKVSAFSAVMAFLAKNIEVFFYKHRPLNVFLKLWIVANIYVITVIRLGVLPVINITYKKLRLFMKRNKKIAVILGARPNFVKAAAFFKEAKKHPDFKFTIIHTNQHHDKEMSDVFFEQMGIPKPDIALEIKASFHTERLGKIFNELKNIFSQKKFDAVIVFGDVNSTLAGAITAAKNNYKIIHIEAGLRSHDRRVPEEINRVVVDHLSDLLFVTEPDAEENLIKEGIPKDKIKNVGNLMIESAIIFKDNIDKSEILSKLNLVPKKYILATIHRQENTDSREDLKAVIFLLKEINKVAKVVLPMHPGTQKIIIKYGMEKELSGLFIVNPLGYFDFMKLMSESLGVVTDSGGIQEETTHLKIPCCTLRESTERPVTVEHGSNKLFSLGTDVLREIEEHLKKDFSDKEQIQFWDNKVSKRIFKEIKKII